MFNNTSNILYYNEPYTLMKGVILPRSEKILPLDQINKKIKRTVGHINYLTGKQICSKNISMRNQILFASERLALLESARKLIQSQEVIFSEERCAEELLSGKDPILSSVKDFSSMCWLLDYLSCLLENKTNNKILGLLLVKLGDSEWNDRFEDIIYKWIETAGIEEVKRHKVLLKFYDLDSPHNNDGVDTSQREEKILNFLDRIIKNEYQHLSISELFRALRYAALYNKTSLLHWFNFGIEKILVELFGYIENTFSEETDEVSKIKIFLNEIINCIQKIKFPSVQFDETYHKWRVLKTRWKNDPSDELHYLERMSWRLQHYFKNNFAEYCQTQRILVQQTLEIKAMLKDTHLIFTHGQGTISWVYNAFCKEMKKLGGNPSRMFQYLRFGENLPLFRTVEQWRGQKYVDDYDPHSCTGEQLLAADGYTLKTKAKGAEAANHFVKVNDNIQPLRVKNAFLKYLQAISSDEKLNKEICDELDVISKEVQQSSDCGNVYVIAIPIAETKNMLYPSHGFGRPCNEFTPEEEIKKLSAFQRDKTILKLYEKCEEKQNQFRILATSLSSKKNHYIFLLSGIKGKKAFKERVKAVARKMITKIQ